MSRTRIMTVIVLAASLLAPAAAYAQQFGAIAYSPSTGAHGYSYDQSSRSRAENRAMRECRSRSRGCKNAGWVRNGCLALAVGDSRGWGTGYHANRSRAKSRSIARCRNNDSGCRVIRWVCS